MELEFGYGKGMQTVEVPEKNLQAVLVANEMEHKRRGPEAVKYSLENPIASKKLRELAKPGQKVVIITSDISRPMPSFDVIPSVLDELNAAGVPDKDITVVFGLGSHRGHTEEEKKKLAGEEAYGRVRCMDSTPDDCVHLGYTKRGTPVDITRVVAEADFRICLGNVEFHYFAGYSGGYKAIMPGVSTPAAIQSNHRMMVLDEACSANLEGNPVREDIEEAGAMLGVDFIVNVVLDEHKHIVYSAAGDVIKAHRDACAYLNKMYLKPIEKGADIVIVSQGGAPKDANLYQMQKALENAKRAVRQGGTIIMVGACPEGLGSKIFEEWMLSAGKPQDIVDRIQKQFQLGGHKAAAIALTELKADIYLVSEIDDELVKKLFMFPKHSLEEAFADAFAKYGKDASVIAMPFGGATLPVLQSQEQL